VTTRPPLYLGLDVGTTGTKALVVAADGMPHGRGGARHRLHSPGPGRYTQDARDWRSAVTAAVREACAGVDPERVAALAVSAQGGTLVPVDAAHEPLTVARSWLDRRATGSAATFERVFGAAEIYRRTGWPIAPNNTAAQLLDLAAGEPEAFASASCFCDTAAFVNGWLTGTPAIDTNVAGIAQLTDAGSATWDADILRVIGVEPARLPRLAAPGTAIGELTERAAAALGLRPGTVVAAGAQDQYCAALGAGAIERGDVLISTGTAWVMLAAAASPHDDPDAGIGWGRHLAPGLWGHFGEVSNGGLSLEWARRLLTHGEHAPLALEELETLLAGTAPGADGLSFFPYFDGTGPYDRDETSRGSLLGLGLGHDHRHVLRAVTEGVAFATRILLEDHRASGGAPVVAGGATRSRAWMQLLADVLGADLLVSTEPDAACVGAAILAAVAVGEVPDVVGGADRMGCSHSDVPADDGASAVYERLSAGYRHAARALGELYATGREEVPT
jgi:sugar (pentulose or hexulose) kinase